jgi:5-(carboxyamino)imidazole ribonucleotide synthase
VTLLITPVLPPAWLGVLGGGQLGRMFCHAAQSMGYKVCVLDPDVNSPAGAAADQHLVAAYLDESALTKMADLCAAVTTEFENVPATALEFLASRCIVSPTAHAVSIAQDRILEKEFIFRSGCNVAPFLAIHGKAEFDAASDELFPGILKSARMGYDGKGQVRVANRQEALRAFEDLQGVVCVLEKRLDLYKEVSVVIARGRDGKIVCLPLAENEHRNGILAQSIVPARLDSQLIADVTVAAESIAHALDYVGVLCVEFFIINSPNGLSWVVNEIAPRPHNSGHYSLDACVTSQFEQQVRTMAQLPLGDSHLLSPCVMLNLLGDIWPQAGLGLPAWVDVLKEPACKLHLYGKAEARPGRKMGHLTLLGEAQESLLYKAKAIERLLGIV